MARSNYVFAEWRLRIVSHRQFDLTAAVRALRSAAVSPNYFGVLGVTPQTWADFETGEDQNDKITSSFSPGDMEQRLVRRFDRRTYFR